MNRLNIIFVVGFTLLMGALNAQNISGVVNTYARVTSITGTTFSINNVSGAIDALAAGQKVLIIQMKGATIERANNIDYGTLLSLNDVGNYEYAIVNNISGYGPTYSISVHNLIKTYDANSFVQIISVPQYNNATVTADLTAAAWDRTTGTGGVLAFEVAGTLTLAANIDVSGKGFAGGGVNPTQFYGSTDNLNFVTTSESISGQKGEGIANYGPEGEYAIGPLANGGGGGNSHNSGGGGGGNFSAGGLGGESYFGSGGNGMGGKQIIADPSLNRLFMGGGGGGGQENDYNASPGGAGGGLILIRANQITSDCSSLRVIRANGADASNTTGNDGAGGGGAGGTILLDVSVFDLSCNIDILTNGGNGGSVTVSDKHGGGGGGGAGAILLPGTSGNAFTNIGSVSGAPGTDCTSCSSTGSPGEVCSGDACAGDGSWPDLANSSPVAVEDNVFTPKNTDVVIQVLDNDRDADFGDVISVSSVTTPPTNGSLTLTGNSFTYTPNTNFAGTDFFTYEICDNGSPVLCSSATVTITVNSILLKDVENDPLNYTEGQAATEITATTTISHIYALPLESAEVKIVNNYVATEDLLEFTNTASITGTWDATGGVLTLTGTASIAEYQTALQSIMYNNTNGDNPSDLVRTVSMSAFDGTYYSNIATRSIAIIPVNDAPVLSALETTALAFTEGDAAKIITSSIVLNDVDNVNMSYAYVWFDANYLGTEDELGFTNANGITGSWDSSTGLLSLSGSASLANYEAALRSVTYRNTNPDNPSTLTRTVTFTAHDNHGVGNKPSRNVAITSINDAPVLAAIETSTLSYTEGDAAKNITATITASDVDNANLSSAKVQISANYLATEDILGFADQNGITGSWDSGTGILTLTGNATNAFYETALRSVTYLNSNTTNPSTATRTVTFETNDGSLSSNTVSRNITVTAVNDAPVLAAIETTALSFTEGDAAKAISNTITINDADHANISGAEIRISANYLVTEDVLTFVNANGISGSWDAATGTFTLTGLATIASYQAALRTITYQNTNGNNPSGATRIISLTVSDGLLTSNSVTRNIEVVPVNDAPVLAAIEPLAISFTEGDAATALTATITLNDADNINMAGASITISGNYVDTEDVLAFTNANGITGVWNKTTGTLTLSGAATIAHYQTALRSITYHDINGDNPSTNTRTVSLSCNDGQLNSNIVIRDITVVAVNDAPILAAIETSTLSFNEGDAAKVISASLTVNDVDNINISGANLQITANYVSTEDALSFTNATGITGSWNTTTGVLTLSGNATLAQYQAAIRSVTYKNINTDNPSDAIRTVSLIINDGVLNSNTLTRDISLIPVNDAPQLANLETLNILFTEGDAPTSISGNITASDVDNASLTGAEIQITTNYLATEDILIFANADGISGSWDAASGKLTLSGSATVGQYQAAIRTVNYQNTNDEKPSVLTRIISLSVTDGGLISNVQTREIEIIPINDAPVTADDIAVTDKNIPVVINVLGNDFDVEDDALTVSANAISAPSNGNLALNADQTFTYTPNFNFFGTDSFVYEVCDNGDPVACTSALVSITINYKNYSPVAEDDLIDILEDETIIIDVLANDSDPDLDEINVSPTIVSAPKYGKVVLDGNQYTYTPNLNYNGNDSFEYQLCDNGTPSICTTALVDIYIDPVNDAPEPADDEYRNKDVIAEIKGNVLDNDYDIEADMLSVDLSTLVLPEHGQLSMNADGSFIYIPNPGFFSEDIFQYFACDDGTPNLCTQATVVLRVSSGVPKGFSPNGDNTNDEWIISGLEEFPMNTVVVLNRYGDIVYEIKGYDNSSRVWRGEVNRGIKLGSGDLPDGTYFYVIDFGDGQSTEKGFVMIKR